MGGEIVLDAMKFAYEVHKDHKRKYLGDPYTNHLAEVVAITASVNAGPVVLATAWLHDTIEDVDVTHEFLIERFGYTVANGVLLLSDLETEGNRAQRKAQSRYRLSTTSDWIQTIKVADLISNTRNIVQHDPKFAVTYLEEKRLLLEMLPLANHHLKDYAQKILQEGLHTISNLV